MKFAEDPLLSAPDRQALIAAWILHHTSKSTVQTSSLPSPQQRPEQDTFWAWETLDELCRVDPDQALNVIVEIVNVTSDDFVIANLAAGPLEDILNFHGQKTIGRIEELARLQPSFRHVLGGVWLSGMDLEVQKRIASVRGETW